MVVEPAVKQTRLTFDVMRKISFAKKLKVVLRFGAAHVTRSMVSGKALDLGLDQAALLVGKGRQLVQKLFFFKEILIKSTPTQAYAL